MDKQNRRTSPFGEVLFFCIAIASLAALCYANIAKGPFLWDDEVLVVNNPLIRDIRNIPAIFRTSAFEGAAEPGNFYRPVQILSYLFNYAASGLNAPAYHITNILLHIINSLLVFYIISHIFSKRALGLVCALFFATHPVHSEAVSYISGRGDLLSAFFLFLSFILFIKMRGSPAGAGYIYLILSCLSYLLGLLSREAALIFPFMIFLYGAHFFNRSENKRCAFAYIAYTGLSAGYIILRMSVLRFSGAAILSEIYSATFIERCLSAGRAFAEYAGLVLFPLHLHMERHFVVTTPADFGFLAGALLFFALLYLYRRWWAGSRQLSFCAGWFVLSLLPMLNIVKPLNATMAEHWLYLPSLGAFGLIAALIYNLYKRVKASLSRYALVSLCAVALLFYSGRTVMRNFQWNEPLALYEHDLRYSPRSFLLNNNVGVEYFRRGDYKRAKAAFEAAVSINPRYNVSRNNLGVIYQREGLLEEAAAEYKASIELNNYYLAYLNLAELYIVTGRLEEARVLLKRALEIYPQLSGEVDRLLLRRAVSL